MVCGISSTRSKCTAYSSDCYCSNTAGCKGSIDRKSRHSTGYSTYGSPLPEVFSIDRCVDPANQSSNQEACDRVDKAAATIHVYRRITDTVHIQITALHDSSDLRRVGVGFQAQLILALVDLLRIIAVDAVGSCPVGILLGEAADGRIVVSCAKIALITFYISIYETDCLTIIRLLTTGSKRWIREDILYSISRLNNACNMISVNCRGAIRIPAGLSEKQHWAIAKRTFQSHLYIF